MTNTPPSLYTNSRTQNVIRTLRYISSQLRQGASHIASEWRVLLLGQLLSLLLTGSGAATATLHINCRFTAPAFQSLFLYKLLNIHLIRLIMKEWRKKKDKLKNKLCIRTKHTVSIQGDCNDDNATASTNGTPLSSDCSDEEDIVDGKITKSSSKEIDTDEQSDEPKYSLCFGLLPISASPWTYFILSFLDVEANYLTFLSFRYTTFTSISIFDSLSIPSAMLLSRLMLGRRYLAAHIAGASICMVGVVINVLSDYESPEPDDYPKKVLGDFLAICGGIIYGLSAGLAENAVKNCGGQEEYLACLGIFGTVISAVQVLLFEKSDVANFFRREDLYLDSMMFDDDTVPTDDRVNTATCSRFTGIGLLFVYVFASYFQYVGVARFLSLSESALLKLSLLTGDLWAVLFSVVAEHIVPPPLFWPALALIISGVFIYEIAPSPIISHDESKNEGVVELSEDYNSWMDNYVSWANEPEMVTA